MMEMYAVKSAEYARWTSGDLHTCTSGIELGVLDMNCWHRMLRKRYTTGTSSRLSASAWRNARGRMADVEDLKEAKTSPDMAAGCRISSFSGRLEMGCAYVAFRIDVEME